MQSFAQSRAVIVGINRYEDGIHSLRTPVCDATALAVLLRRRHGYCPVYLRTERQATLAGLRLLLSERVPRSTNERDRLLFYFAGHGVALEGKHGPEGFLLPSDARRADRNSYLPMSELSAALEALGYHHLMVILDCCFAGAFSWASGRETDLLPDSVLYRERYAHYVESPTWQVLTSAWYNQRALDVGDGFSLGSRDDDGGEHSPFAAQLLAALQGEADILPRPDGDGVITATELYAYLLDRFADLVAARQQTPMLWHVRREDVGQYIFANPTRRADPEKLEPTPPLDGSDNPYRGLKSYTQDDAGSFFAREELVHGLVEHVIGSPFTVVLGASGAGKTSLVQAGLLPRLVPPAQPNWYLLEVIRPGAQPLRVLGSLRLPSGATLDTWCAAHGVTLETSPAALAGALQEAAGQGDGQRVLLVVDQAEELFTVCDAPAQGEQFIRLIVDALGALPRLLHVVFTLRSDYEVHFDLAALRKYWTPAARFIVPALAPADLRQVIVKPAAAIGLRFDPPDLVDEIILEVAEMPGALPLLSFTLSEMFVCYLRRQDSARQKGEVLDRTLTRGDYDELGGVIGSIRRRADALYEALDPLYRRTMRRLMLRMVSVDGVPARRRVFLSELEFPDPDETVRAAWVLERLSGERLVVQDRDAQGAYCEPGHDALVLNWPRLRSWIGEEQEKPDSLSVQQRMAQAAQEWRGALEKERAGAPARANLLMQRWLWARRYFEVTGREAEDLLWSSTERNTLLELTLARPTHWMNQFETQFAKASVRHNRQRRLLSQILVAMLALLTVGAVGAAVRAGLQRRETLGEQSQLWSTLGQRQLTEDPVASIHLALTALPGSGNPRPYEAEAEYTLYQALQSSLERAHVAIGTRIVNDPLSIAYGRVAVATENGLVALPYLPDLQAAPILTSTEMDGVAWNPGNASTLLAYAGREVSVWTNDRQVARRTFDAAVGCASWDPAGDQIAICAGRQVWLWQPGADVREVAHFPGDAQQTAWSPNGRWLAAYDRTGQFALWDVRAGMSAMSPRPDHASIIQVFAWAPDGDHFVTTQGGTIHVWSVWARDRLAVMQHGTPEDRTRLVGVEFDGQEFLTWGSHPAIIRWGLDGSERAVYRIPSGARVQRPGIIFSEDRQRMLVIAGDGRGYIWDLRTGPPTIAMLEEGANVTAAAWRGNLLATGDAGDRVRIWDVSAAAMGGGPARVTTLYGHSAAPEDDIVWVQWLAGQTAQLLSLSSDGSVRIWDILDAQGNPYCFDDSLGNPRCRMHTHLAAYAAQPVKRAHWLADGRVGALTRECALLLWTPGDPATLVPTNMADGCEVAWSPDGGSVLVYTLTEEEVWPRARIFRLDGGAAVRDLPQPVLDAVWLEPGILVAERVKDSVQTRLIDPHGRYVRGRSVRVAADLDMAVATGNWITAPGETGDFVRWNAKTEETYTLSRAEDLVTPEPPRLDWGLAPILQEPTQPAGSAALPFRERQIKVLALAAHANGNILLSAALVVTPTPSAEVILWNAAGREGRRLASSQGRDPRATVAISSDSNLIALVNGAEITVIDAVEGTVWWQWRGHDDTIKGLQWLSVPKWRGLGRRPLLLSWSGDGSARIWDLEEREALLHLAHDASVEYAEANADASSILTVDEKGVLHIWQTWWSDRAGLLALAEARMTRPLTPEQAEAFLAE